MISITSEDLKSFREISSGAFGTLYQVDDQTAYKIYHKMVHDKYFQSFPNPALRMSNKRLDRLKRHAAGVKYTDVWQDKIILDGEFGGISLPYYDGPLMYSYMNSPFPVKIRIAREFVRNGKELADHLIYPTDYKMNNVMTHQGKVKIIDLDDQRTKTPIIPSIIFFNDSTLGLNETVAEFFEEYQYAPYSLMVASALGRERVHVDNTFQFIDRYLLEKEKPVSFLLIDSTSDLGVIQNLLLEKDYRVIYVFRGVIHHEDRLLELIEELRGKGISVYDVLFDSYLDHYFHNYNVESLGEVRGKQFIKK